MILKTAEIADFFGVSTRAVRKWNKQGCPKHRHGQWDLKAVFRWWLTSIYTGGGGDRLDLAQERAKLTRAKREKVALEIEEIKGRLVSAKIVTELWQRFVLACRAKLLAMPTKCAGAVLTAETEAEAAAILKRAVYDALNELHQDLTAIFGR